MIPLSPFYRLEVNGVPVPEEVMRDIHEVTFESELHEMDNLTIRLSNPSTGEVPKAYQNLFSIRKTVSLSVGYAPDAPQFVGAAIIDELEPRYEDQSLVVRGLDAGYLMTKKPSKLSTSADDENPLGDVAGLSKVLANLGKSLSLSGSGEDDDTETQVDAGGSVLDMIDSVAKDYGFLKDVANPVEAVATLGGGVELGFAREAHKSKYEFIEEEAAKIGFDFFVRYNPKKKKWVLHFHPPRSDQERTLLFQFNAGDERSNILSFHPDFTDRDVEEERGLLKIITPNLPPGSQEHTAPLIAEIVEVITTTSFDKPEAAQAFATSMADRRNQYHLNADLVVLGTPSLLSGDVHRLSGLSSKYVRDLSGLYRFLSVQHRLSTDEGYACDCRVVRLAS